MHQAVIFARLPQDPAAQQQLADLHHIARHLAQREKVHFAPAILDPTPLRTPAAQRPALQQLLTLSRQRAVQRVLVSSLTHLANSRLDLAPLVEELTQLGISLYLHELGIETLEDGQPNVAVLHFIEAMAQQAHVERAKHRTRIREGLAVAKQQGKRLGRPPGSTVDRAAYLKKYARVVRQLRQGLSVRQAAACCQVAATTVAKVKALL